MNTKSALSIPNFIGSGSASQPQSPCSNQENVTLCGCQQAPKSQWASAFGVLVLVLAYTALGSVLFVALEGEAENGDMIETSVAASKPYPRHDLPSAEMRHKYKYIIDSGSAMVNHRRFEYTIQGKLDTISCPRSSSLSGYNSSGSTGISNTTSGKCSTKYTTIQMDIRFGFSILTNINNNNRIQWYLSTDTMGSSCCTHLCAIWYTNHTSLSVSYRREFIKWNAMHISSFEALSYITGSW
ncbi:uncharacterized protein LOC125956350 isoform X2 [Anopheles darlingi]|uniref:uncharacterized protein LOC125956350 isoform X2 n=1 Tax=Anopheles darlingi TaxID=43151 RepID=UPI00210045FA|nr:uncharacterized protein LOC125956350 isoform X2 [Anopheles darlingi]